MKSWSEEDRPVKDQIRKIVAQQCQKGKKKILVMPSDMGLDIKTLIEESVPDKNCHWIVVERDSKKLQSFKKKKLIPSTKTTYYNQELNTIPYPKEVTLAWFDLCGNLTKEDVLWFKNFPLNKNSEIFFTFSLVPRGNNFFNKLCETIYHQYSNEINSIIRESIDFSFDLRKINPKHQSNIAIRWILLRYLFPPSPITCRFYQDTVPMVLFHLKNFEESKKPDLFNNFIDSFLNQNYYSDKEIVSAILKAKSQKEFNLIKNNLTLLLNNTSEPQDYKEKLRAKVIEAQKKIVENLFN